MPWRARKSLGEQPDTLRQALQALRDVRSSARNVGRILRDSKGPPHLRSPEGTTDVSGGQVCVSVYDTEQHHAEIEEIFDSFDDAGEPDVAVAAWLDGAHTDASPDTVSVVVGQYTVGHLSDADSRRIRPWIESMSRRGRIVGTDIFITRSESGYVVEVNLPARQP
jgi:hypothetical protein